MVQRSGKFVFVKDRSDGRIIDIPAEHLEIHLKRGWELVGTEDESNKAVEELFQEPTVSSLDCPLCSFKATNEKGLKIHKARSHK